MQQHLFARALRAVCLLVALVTSRSAHAGELWRIGGDSADALSASAALECAGDGDVLLFAKGVHEIDTLLGERTLTLVGEPGARLRGHMTITGEDPVVAIRLIGLQIEGLPWTWSAAVNVRDFVGRVWIQGCDLRGGDPYETAYPPLAEAGEALRVVNCAEVVIHSSSLRGGPAAPTEVNGPPPAPGPAALHCVASRVGLFDCVLRGGDGGSDDHGLSAWAGEGGPGLFQRAGARSYLWQTRLRGGNGGLGLLSVDGLGGTGLHTEGWSVESHALRVDGGSGSRLGVGVFQAGGVMHDQRSWLRELVVTNPNRDDGELTVMVRGIPGESVVLELSRESNWPERTLHQDSVPTMLGRVGHEVPLGLIPPSGVILRQFPTGSLPPGEAEVIYAQLRHETQLGAVRGPAMVLVMLDATN